MGCLKKTAVGKYAILTNKSVILQKGCILSDATYISNDDELPNLNDSNGHIRQFKGLFSTDDDLKDFEFNFCHILENKSVSKVWDRLNSKLSDSWQGKDLIINHKLEIHSIINLHKNSYGTSLR